MATKRRYSCDIDRREEEHLKLLEELDLLTLSDSCCAICHCDCYNSHRSVDDIIDRAKDRDSRDSVRKNNNKSVATKKVADKKSASNIEADGNNNHKLAEKRKSHHSTATDDKINIKGKVRKKRQERRHRSRSPEFIYNKTKRKRVVVPLKRSKSAGSLHSTRTKSHFTRDCELLQDLLTTFDTPRLEITSHMRSSNQDDDARKMISHSKSTLELPSRTSSRAAVKLQDATIGWSMPKICDSLANLCLVAPVIREAYQKVSIHDKKILDRMANKRSEKVLAKENAWLARKFWENERYERELLKCEQMEEYKRAVRDKQFQDYLLTKERLNELAQRDYQELQRLRQTIAHKDALTKQRLDALRVERGITQCQRRCEELRKSETVNVHQEEQHLGELMRKKEICDRLNDRLRRADQIRNQVLDGYLKRLRYDNYVEQLMHDQHWRETQEMEYLKREQLKDHINAKSKGTQQFIEQRQKRMQNLTKTAKISASLRELVRSNVTLEGSTLAPTTTSRSTSTSNLGKLLLDVPFSKTSKAK